MSDKPEDLPALLRRPYPPGPPRHILLKAADEIDKLRAVLSRVAAHLHNPFEPDNQSDLYKRVSDALEREGDA